MELANISYPFLLLPLFLLLPRLQCQLQEVAQALQLLQAFQAQASPQLHKYQQTQDLQLLRTGKSQVKILLPLLQNFLLLQTCQIIILE